MEPIDVYWSFRSPYSYLATPGLVKLTEDYDVEVNLRVVFPIALRANKTLFDASNKKPAIYIVMDCIRRAQFLGMPMSFPPKPDPVTQDYETFQVADDQPLIMRLAKLGVEAQRRGKGLAFAKEVSHLIYGGTEGWDQGDHLHKAARAAGLDLVSMEQAIENGDHLADIDRNHADLDAAGHWGDGGDHTPLKAKERFMTDKTYRPNRRALLAGASVLAAAAASPSTRAQEGEAVPDFKGKSVLITGTSSGFGRLTALHLARLGATVIASMRNYNNGERAEARELTTIAQEESLNLSVVEIDVLDDTLIASGVAEAEEIAGGALDVLVNNAGIGIAGPVEVNDMDATRLIFETNLYGYLRMARAVLPKMRARQQGQIFNVSSQLGRILIPNLGMYCATKFGVEAMFETMAYELAPFGVEVTIIQPGGYPTKIWENGGRYMDDLLSGADEERLAAYEGHLQMASGLMSGQYSTDPMDVPRAISEIIAMPAGKRPLRRPVHPNTTATASANAAMAQIQAAVLGGGGYASWHEAVTD
ncbi:Retinol dehydrogenase 8 (Photoreceptor outer segment all-trans retinol dehydrogenase) (Short chain dehydrogenase/reductase family 28C member 2) [Durusdinium trenchii]|uniref:Retinol dehydrogenase 8 (Photoreceptor outer segment all-trans retinol dehydrogenase) (Short chain dehydrogenase/reductase family 28C member 2) n=1 Tax=Durusdinium trenchii TaxID=1381693 RepID=A0ABP0LLD7_9DINO